MGILYMWPDLGKSNIIIIMANFIWDFTRFSIYDSYLSYILILLIYNCTISELESFVMQPCISIAKKNAHNISFRRSAGHIYNIYEPNYIVLFWLSNLDSHYSYLVFC